MVHYWRYILFIKLVLTTVSLYMYYCSLLYLGLGTTPLLPQFTHYCDMLGMGGRGDHTSLARLRKFVLR